MVRTHPDPPTSSQALQLGAIAQLGERLLCKQEVIGSIPIGSTSFPEGIAKPCGAVAAVLRCVLHRLFSFFNNSDEVKRSRRFLFEVTG
jgi:hypothetical protein